MMEVETIIPHRLPMRLIDTLIEINGETAVVEAVITEDNILLDGNGVLDNVAYVEMIAQSYATLRGYQERQQGAAMRDGFMVSVRKAQNIATAYCGDCLHIKVAKTGEFESFTMAEGEIYRGEELMARAQISLWIPEVIGGTANVSGAMEELS